MPYSSNSLVPNHTQPSPPSPAPYFCLNSHQRAERPHPLQAHSPRAPGSAVHQPLGSSEHRREHSPAHPTGQFCIPSTSPLSTQQPRSLPLASKPPHLSPEAKMALVSCGPSGRTVLSSHSVSNTIIIPSQLHFLSFRAGFASDLSLWLPSSWGFPDGSGSKEFPCNAGDPGSIPGLGRSPGEGNGNPFQYSCLENSMDRGVWWTIVQGVAKSQPRLSDKYSDTFTHNPAPTFIPS